MNLQKCAKKCPLVKILSDRCVKKMWYSRTGLGLLGDYKTLAQWIGRCEDTFINFIQVFAIGINKDFPATNTDNDDEEHDDNDDTTPHYLSKKINFILYVSKFFFHPWFSPGPHLIQMNTALSISRSDDIRSLCEIGLSYVAALQPNKVLLLPILPNSLKEDYCGWNHAVLAELLCPIEHIAAFRKDLSGTCQKFQDRTLSITSDQLMLYMYCGQRVNVERIDDVQHNNVTQTWHHLFQSSRLDDWQSNELNFSKDELFNTVLDLFKQEVSRSWAKATLEEWNITQRDISQTIEETWDKVNISCNILFPLLWPDYYNCTSIPICSQVTQATSQMVPHFSSHHDVWHHTPYKSTLGQF
ncbi:hypothetical protein BGW80DRAFT_1257905 [Lactifluus volemus]|nr:hypothetical protein BGW80DRAFT_1257905 [Lactifluus volemus]